MGKKLFTIEEIKELKKNPNVAEVNEDEIRYRNKFKIFFVEQYNLGIRPKEIFRTSGFDTKVLGDKRIERATARWKESYSKGTLGKNDDIDVTKKRNAIKAKERLDKIRIQTTTIDSLERQVELLKKVDDLERRRTKLHREVGIQEIQKKLDEMNQEKSIKGITRKLLKSVEISKSGYYAYLKNKDNNKTRDKKDELLKELILMAFNYKGYKKGSRSIKMLLENEYGIIINRKCIQRIMRKYSIVCPVRTVNPYRRMWAATKEDRIADNILERKFKSGIPGKVLLTDITYLKYKYNQTAYLSTILDAETKVILAFVLKTNMKMPLVMELLEQLNLNSLSEGVMIHSDQGVHYTSKLFRDRLKELNIIQSMSRRGNCWDNAPQESFYGHFKDEVNIGKCHNFDEVLTEVTNYISYYNNERCQIGLGKRTPIQYEEYLYQKQENLNMCP